MSSLHFLFFLQMNESVCQRRRQKIKTVPGASELLTVYSYCRLETCRLNLKGSHCSLALGDVDDWTLVVGDGTKVMLIAPGVGRTFDDMIAAQSRPPEEKFIFTRCSMVV